MKSIYQNPTLPIPAQKVMHAESVEQLLAMNPKIKADLEKEKTIILREKVNGLYASISLQELLGYSEKPYFEFIGRNKLTHKIDGTLVPSLTILLELGELMLTELIHDLSSHRIDEDFDPIEFMDCHSTIDTVEKFGFNPARVFIAGELAGAYSKQDFSNNSSVLRKKEIVDQCEFHPFLVWNMDEQKSDLGFINYFINYFNKFLSKPQQRFFSAINQYFILARDFNEAYLSNLAKEEGIEGFVYYDSSNIFYPNKRTANVIALKFPLRFNGTIIGFTYAPTVRGHIITRVNVRLSTGQELVLGSGIDDRLRTLLESTHPVNDEMKIRVTVKAEKRNETGALNKPVIESYMVDYREGDYYAEPIPN